MTWDAKMANGEIRLDIIRFRLLYLNDLSL